jgi:hypothetical protein
LTAAGQQRTSLVGSNYLATRSQKPSSHTPTTNWPASSPQLRLSAVHRTNGFELTP